MQSGSPGIRNTWRAPTSHCDQMADHLAQLSAGLMGNLVEKKKYETLNHHWSELSPLHQVGIHIEIYQLSGNLYKLQKTIRNISKQEIPYKAFF